jgi:hypothetical protein
MGNSTSSKTNTGVFTKRGDVTEWKIHGGILIEINESRLKHHYPKMKIAQQVG